MERTVCLKYYEMFGKCSKCYLSCQCPFSQWNIARHLHKNLEMLSLIFICQFIFSSEIGHNRKNKHGPLDLQTPTWQTYHRGGLCWYVSQVLLVLYQHYKVIFLLICCAWWANAWQYLQTSIWCIKFLSRMQNIFCQSVANRGHFPFMIT